MAHHADLLDPEFWQQHKERIKAGYVHDVFPYDRARRFTHQIHAWKAADAPSEDAPVDEPVDVRPLGKDVHDQGVLTGFTAEGNASGD
jgi:isocitrate dehydrogenase kinase/phosphatase